MSHAWCFLAIPSRRNLSLTSLLFNSVAGPRPVLERGKSQICDFRCDLEAFADWRKLASVCSSGSVKTPVPDRVGNLKRNGREALIG